MLDLLYNLVINPLVNVIEFFYNTIFSFSNNHIASIIFLSILINTLVLPLYLRADELQQTERNKQKSMEMWVKHISKAFKGDEKFFRLQAYYREQNYKPIYALKASISLLLQIPFFTAAYLFFTSSNMFDGIKAFEIGNKLLIAHSNVFYLIKDLGKPDAIATIGGFSINLLPIIMTIINISSSLVYTKGFSVQEKIRTLVLPIIFLMILYNSPSGLVIYWTCNNLYSLIRNIIVESIEKIKVKNEVNIFQNELKNDSKIKYDKNIITIRDSNLTFIFSIISLTILLGIIIPIMLIDASPTEFQEFSATPWYIISYTFTAYLGLSLWVTVFYLFCKNEFKYLFAIAIVLLLLFALVDFLFFGNSFGNITTTLEYEEPFAYQKYDYLNNITGFVTILVIVLILKNLFVKIKNRKIYVLNLLLIAFTITLIFVSAYRICSINGRLKKIEANEQGLSKAQPVFKLSKNGKNVIILMMDCTKGVYLPYIFNSIPDLKKKYDGFTYYPNTISFGAQTITGKSGIFGGYEYIPYELNKISDETLKLKNEKALTVLPTLFNNAGYNVTTCDVANDLVGLDKSFWSKYDFVNAVSLDYNYNNKLSTKGNRSKSVQIRKFVKYSFMRAMPTFAQLFIYDNGNYFIKNTIVYKSRFLRDISKLNSLPEYTIVAEDDSNNYVEIVNMTAHDSSIVSYPDYEPTIDMRNLADESIEYKDEIGNIIKGHDCIDANIAMYMQLGKYFDYMRKNDVYENTRIVIVSDHGRGGYFDTPTVYKKVDGKKQAYIRTECFIPILLVKDFNSKGFNTDSTFMTNADTPWIVMNGIVENKINPYTGKNIDDKYKFDNELLYILPTYASHIFDKKSNSLLVNSDKKDYIFLGCDWQSKHDLRLKRVDPKSYGVITVKSNSNIYDENSWNIDLDRIYKYNKKFNKLPIEE